MKMAMRITSVAGGSRRVPCPTCRVAAGETCSDGSTMPKRRNSHPRRLAAAVAEEEKRRRKAGPSTSERVARAAFTLGRLHGNRPCSPIEEEHAIARALHAGRR